MQRCTTVGFAFLLAALAGSPVDAQPKGGESGWLPSFSDGKARAAKSGKPIMLVLRCAP